MVGFSVLAVRHPVVIMLFAFTVSLAESNGRAKQIAAGHIEECSRPCSAIAVVRAGGDAKSREPLPAAMLMPLFVEDRIEIADAGQWLKIRFGPRELLTVEKRDSPYFVPHPRPGSSPIKNFTTDGVRRIVAVFGLFSSRQEARQAVSLTSRSPGDEDGLPLYIGLLRHPDLKIAAGRRPFTLRWHGGAPPFSVRLYRDGELAPVAAVEDLRQRETLPMKVAFTPGRYRIEVREHGERPVTGEFAVVPAAQLPVPPARADLAALPPALGRVLTAAWRAGQDDGAWAYDSFLEAAALAADFPPAAMLRDGLAEGDLPRFTGKE